MIRFLHAGQLVELSNTPPDTTVLEYLRDHCSLTGTKEGCASGDCGACTVVTAQPSQTSDGDSTLEYRPLNACIAPLGSLHGKQLISVEELEDEGELHPVQQAMVDCHASQCGFCTPGFVMSLFALYHRFQAHAQVPERELINEALGGNLCRCTGYRPIIAAAEHALEVRANDKFDLDSIATRNTLLDLRSLELKNDSAESSNDVSYHLPDGAEEAAALIARYPDAKVVAGGTDLMLEVTQQLQHFESVIDLRTATDLQQTKVTAVGIAVGAAVSHAECSKPLLADYPELAELIERFGSLQIRSQGTLVGNIANASPIGDWPPVLLALDGSLSLQSTEGVRALPVDEFFLDYRKTALAENEFIAEARFPRRSANLFLRAYKISKRFEDDISSLCLVIALQMEGDTVSSARIACGGMAATPKRALQCEEALKGINLREADLGSTVTALESDFDPISDARASADYRRRTSVNLLRRLQAEYRGDANTRTHAVTYTADHAL